MRFDVGLERVNNYVQSHIITLHQHASITAVTIIMVLLATFVLYSCVNEMISIWVLMNFVCSMTVHRECFILIGIILYHPDDGSLLTI
jgi:hypothetical protein